MHDNKNIDIRCTALWAAILSALENRVASVNKYVPDKASHIVVKRVGEDAVQLHHASSERVLSATMDVKKHVVHVKEFRDRSMARAVAQREMPLSLLADGELYVTDGNELKANAMEVAKAFMEALLAKKTAPHVSA